MELKSDRRVQWTKPYCGIEHVIGLSRESELQGDVTEYAPGSVHADLFSVRTFKSLHEGWFSTVEAAKVFLEERIRALGLSVT